MNCEFCGRKLKDTALVGTIILWWANVCSEECGWKLCARRTDGRHSDPHNTEVADGNTCADCGYKVRRWKQPAWIHRQADSVGALMVWAQIHRSPIAEAVMEWMLGKSRAAFRMLLDRSGAAANVLCLCPASSEYDPPCPEHGIRPIGMRGDGSWVVGEYDQ